MNASAFPAIRAFYAILPPPDVRHALGQLAQAIGQQARGRAVPAENVHLTLAFVGAWPTSRVDALHAAGAAVRAVPFRLTLDLLGGFRRSGIAWLGSSHPAPQLITLAGVLGDALRAHEVTYEARVFRPHVTLARRLRAPGPDGTIDPLEWDVDAFSLMESHTTAQGMCYETLATWPLGAPAGQ